MTKRRGTPHMPSTSTARTRRAARLTPRGLAAGASHSKSDTVFKGTPWANVTEADIPEAQEIAQGIEQACGVEIEQAKHHDGPDRGDDAEEKADAAEAKKPEEPEAEIAGADDGKDEHAAKPEEKPSKDDVGDDTPPTDAGDGADDADEADEADDEGADDDKSGDDLPMAAKGAHGDGSAHADDGKDDHEAAAHGAAAGIAPQSHDGGGGEHATDAALHEDAKHHEADHHDAAARDDHYAQLDDAMQPTGEGQPLSEATRAHMEDAVGIDLGDVRLHAGGAPAEILTALGGKAAAKGRHILMANGFDPESKDGHEILEHELHHVAQFSEGRVGNIASAAGNGQRAELEADAGTRQARRQAQRGQAKASGKQRARLPNGGPALYFGIPNPIDVAKDVGGAVVSGAKKVGSTVVGAGKDAVHFVKKTAGKIFSGIRDAVTKVIGYVRDAVRGVMSALGHLKDIANWLRGLPVVGKIIGGAVDAVTKAAHAAAVAYRTAKRKAKQLVAGARRLAAYTRKIASRGPAYFEAARAAAAGAVRAGVDAAGNVYERGKDAIARAVHAVYEQGKRAFNASAHAIRVAYKGLKNATKAVGRGIARAAKWTAKNAGKLSNIATVALDVAGFLPPPVGPIADVSNALIKAAKGDWKGAALDLGAAIPVVGDAAKAGKYGAKGTKLAIKAQKGLDKMVTFGKTSSKAAHVKIKNAHKAIKDIAARNRDKIDRFKDQLGDRFDTLEARYRDFQPKVRKFIGEKRDDLKGFRENLAASMHKYKEQAARLEKVKDFYDKVKGLHDDVQQVKEDWGIAAPPPPVNLAGPPPVPGIV